MNPITHKKPNSSVSVDKLLETLHPYMFSLKTLTHAKQHTVTGGGAMENTSSSDAANCNKTLKNDQLLHEKGSEMFFPKERDQLFWCYYILVHGYSAYEMIDTHRFIVEKNEKLKCVEHIRLNRKHLTTNKIRGIDAIENMLVHDHTIDVKAFIALCVASNLNILFIHRRKSYHVLLDVDNMEPENIHVVHQYDTPRTRYGYEMGVTSSKMNEYLCRPTQDHTTPYYVNAVSITNPLRAISSYKVGELRDMVIKLKLLDNETAWKKTKPQIYETIVQNL
jgi:hypothetical protein